MERYFFQQFLRRCIFCFSDKKLKIFSKNKYTDERKYICDKCDKEKNEETKKKAFVDAH